MIRTLRARIAAAAGAGLLVACTQTDLPADPSADPPADPCAAPATCLQLYVDSFVIQTIDQLELDVVYALHDDQILHHDTVTTGTIGKTVDLPTSLPLVLDLPGSPLIDVDLIAAGELGGSVLGATGRSVMVQQGHQATVGLLLEPTDPCVEGALYCGGTSSVFADLNALYRCTGGVPRFYAACSSGCFPHFEPNAMCTGGGLCRDGGTDCGGGVLNGDP